VAARPFGLLVGFQTHHPFGLRPSYRELADLAIDERIEFLRRPAVRSRILAEDDVEPDGKLFSGMPALLRMALHKLYVLGDPPDYEPEAERSVAHLAQRTDTDPLEAVYDALCEQDGEALLMLPLFNYTDGDHEAIREQLLHPTSVSGLSDGGAHCGMICDASIPTYLLTHWTRDRKRGARLPLEWVVRKQTRDTAHLFGLTDRGELAVGKKADLNVIDLENLTLHSPRLVHDLPAGGRRLLQDAVGYRHTIVSGHETRCDGVDTGARPGRLIRGT
jgi:N-acyl-D-aspartate/D-glutamate deacylase